MHAKFIIALAAAFNSASVLAAPVQARMLSRSLHEIMQASSHKFVEDAAKRDDNVTEFFGAQYSRLYKEAKEAGLTKRDVDENAIEFFGAQYSHLYKEAKDAGVAKRDNSAVEFVGRPYAILYKEAANAGLVQA
jgi:hypothetical protein